MPTLDANVTALRIVIKHLIEKLGLKDELNELMKKSFVSQGPVAGASQTTYGAKDAVEQLGLKLD